MNNFGLVKNKGYWKVNGVEYNIKLNAVLAAQEQNLTHTDITYHYNDYYWDKFNWHQEPKQSIDELYIQRAQDLRAKYKTLILRFSGGADSTNILRTFLDNNIKIDIVAVNMWNQPGVDPYIQPSNIEKRDIALPYLEALKKQGADFKVIVNDFSPVLSIIKDDPDWIFKFDAPRFSIVDLCLSRALNTPEFTEWDHPDTCIITGVDKPMVWCKQGKIWYFALTDVLHDIHQSVNNMTQEPFYWTADMPEIPIKQSHLVKKFWSNHVDKIPHQGYSSDTRTFWSKTSLIPLIYPKYFGNIDPFSKHLPYYDMSDVTLAYRKGYGHAPRGTGIDFGIDQSEYYDVWKQGIDTVDKLVDRRFKNYDSIWKNGLVVILSKSRWIGK
jgi:hypothetical protein